MSVFNTVAGYTFASSRYHSTFPISSIWQDENYSRYDKVNGTYDKYWPCFALTESPEPVLSCLLPDNSITAVQGDVAPFPYERDYGKRTMGAINYQHQLVNSNLDRKTISFNSWIYSKLTIGWGTIQTFYMTRILADSTTAAFLYALELPKENSTLSFPAGLIVSYDKKTYKCIKATSSQPTTDSQEWELLQGTNAFVADVFTFSPTEIKYSTTVTDPVRVFQPSIEVNKEDSNLISWNVSYWST